MSNLKYPFEKSALLSINNDANLLVEIAESPIEIFQSVNYRTKKDFNLPLVLKFSNPLTQAFSLQEFAFDIEQILIESDTNLVRGIQLIKKHNYAGSNVQSFAGFSLVILAPVGFSKKHGIKLNQTTIIFQLTLSSQS
jgi:uncharacterized membrane protein (UPF0127 family)